MCNNAFNHGPNKLRIGSYNLKHFQKHGPKFDFICDIMHVHDILFLQEHWLYKSELPKLKSVCGGVSSTAKSSMDETEHRRGRPFGGCAILWHSNIAYKMSPAECTNNRLCGIIMSIDNATSVLMLNVYMPCDSQRQDDSYYQFVDVINEIDQLINRYDATHVLFGGDLNTELTRNTPQSKLLREYIYKSSMTACIDLPCANVPYTYICPMTSRTSRIDHFMASSALGNSILSCSIVDNHIFSDHVPVTMEIDINVVYQKVQDKVFEPKPAWYKASTEQIQKYKDDCENALKQISYNAEALTCTDKFCDKHGGDIEQLYNNVINTVIDSAKVIPTTTKRNHKTVPGWNQYVEDLKKESLHWHSCWKSQGRPHHGPCAEIMRLSRARYHRAVRQVKREEDKICMAKMADAISRDNTRDLFSEVRKMKGSSNYCASIIDGCADNDSIANMFGTKYDNLYNSVPYNEKEMNDIKCKIDNLVQKDNSNYYITVSDVVKSISHLKSGKASGEEQLYSDHIIHAPHLLHVFLSMLFNAMLVHGMSPNSMIVGTMVPIPKCKYKELDNSDNYRSIALSSVIGKTFDWVILIKEQNALCTSDLQFGFKAGTSTTQCTHVFLETINYYNFQGTNVYSVLLDATKAFDRVQYCKLFKELLRRNVNPLIIRLLLFMYTNQTLQVKWGNSMSKKFSVLNGVKQGGVLSPILFAVYMDGLINRLKRSGIGCHVGNWYVGCLAFADDLTLLAPTIDALIKLVKICEDYANEYSVKFNGLKSKLLIFKGRGCNISRSSITVNGSILNNTDTAMHLGHKVSTNDKDSVVHDAIGSFWKSFNMFIADLGHIYSYIKCKLFKQYCCSFYGAPLWNLYNKGSQDIFIAWRKALRVVWNIPYMSHRKTVALLSDCMPLEYSLKKRFVRFYKSCLNSNSSVVQGITKMARFNPMSTCCNNYIEITREYKISEIDLNIHVFNDQWKNDISNEELGNISVLKEMISIRDGYMTCNVFNADLVKKVIDDICVN